MSYRPKTNFRNKDAMERGDPYKRVRGSELQDEFEAISRAVATQGSQIENIDNSVENIINNGGGGGGGTSGPVAWDDVTGKPASYPPETHNHDGEYLKDFTEEDPTVPDHVKSISQADITGWNAASSGTAPVTSVNTKTGAVVLDASDVGALPDTFAEADPTVPDHVKSITEDDIDRWDVAAGIDVPVTSVNGMDGDITLTASDVGALPDSTTIPPAAPVDSVNSKTGAVVLNASDVGALPDTYTPPDAPVGSVNGKTGAVTLSASDVGAQPAGDYSLATHDHAGVYQPVGNYLTSYTETDPTVGAHIKAITPEQIAAWDTPSSGGGMEYEIDQQFTITTADAAAETPPSLIVNQSYNQYSPDYPGIEVSGKDGASIRFRVREADGSERGNAVFGYNHATNGTRYFTVGQRKLGEANGKDIDLGGSYPYADSYWFRNCRISGTYTGTTSFTSRSFQNGAPVIDARELISVLSDLRDVTKDAAVTSVDSLKTAMSSKLDSLVDRLTRGIEESRAVDEDAWAYTTMSEDDYNNFMGEKYGEPEE